MIASELIEELSKYPAYVPVQVTANHIEIEELRFEGNYIELRVDATFNDPADEEKFTAQEELEEAEKTANDAVDLLWVVAASMFPEGKSLNAKQKAIRVKVDEFLKRHG